MTRAELLAQAQALEDAVQDDLNAIGLRRRAAALRAQADAAGEPEPVAWRYKAETGPDVRWVYSDGVPTFVLRAGLPHEPLYTAPPANRARGLLSALESLTDPEYRFDSAINPGPERDELQRAYDAYKGIKR